MVSEEGALSGAVTGQGSVAQPAHDGEGNETHCGVFTDANNGYTLNGAVAFLYRVQELDIGWLEEPFAEDRVLLRALHHWITTEQAGVLIADGESAGAEEVKQLAGDGVLDVAQCDILGTSFNGWLRLGAELDRLGVASAPHHFGLYLDNYVTGHLAVAVKGLRYVEWDEATVPRLEPRGYGFKEGRLQVSREPGFAIALDEVIFTKSARAGGFDIRLVATP